MLKLLKCCQALYCQKILLPGMAWAVGIEQTHKAIFDRRIEVVGKESFTMFQPDQCQHLFHSQLIIPQCFYQLKYSGIIGRELVRFSLWGTCGVSSPAPAASGRSLSVLRSQYGAALQWEDRSDTWRQKAVHYRATRSSVRYPDWFQNKAIYQ